MTRVRCRASRSPPAALGQRWGPGWPLPRGKPFPDDKPGSGYRATVADTPRRRLHNKAATPPRGPGRTQAPPEPGRRQASRRHRAGRGCSAGRRAGGRGSGREFCSLRRCPPGPGLRARRAPEPNAGPAALTSRQRRPPPPPWPPCCVSAGLCFLAGSQAAWAAVAAPARACVARPLARPRGAAARLRVPGHQPRPRDRQLRMRSPAGRAPVGSGQHRQTDLAVYAVADFSNDSVKASCAGMDYRVLGTR